MDLYANNPVNVPEDLLYDDTDKNKHDTDTERSIMFTMTDRLY